MALNSIVCPWTSHKELDMLNHVLSLLRAHLKRPWTAVKDGDGPILLVDLDAVDSDAVDPDELGRRCSDRLVYGYAERFREIDGHCGPVRLSGAIHRGFRAAELLAILQRYEQSGAPAFDDRADGAVQVQVQGSMAYRVSRWPPGSGRMSRDSRRIVAALTRQAMSPAQISERLGVSARVVRECLIDLQKHGVLERGPLEASVPAQKPPNAPRMRGVLQALRRRIGLSK